MRLPPQPPALGRPPARRRQCMRGGARAGGRRIRLHTVFLPRLCYRFGVDCTRFYKFKGSLKAKIQPSGCRLVRRGPRPPAPAAVGGLIADSQIEYISCVPAHPYILPTKISYAAGITYKLRKLTYLTFDRSTQNRL
ncbi:hypothetical protein EVAR_36141_1 [Eumeta japonica]|uniref:Uncharacterized protein n=1 Tax=Eumeta variegata TaxID=151549 RepID=A0A4C1X536_EUMVA|nr:hypothetical protein EVAR_36141_1 [Eumeta japonica]